MKIIENALPQEALDEIRGLVLNDMFPWNYIHDKVAYDNDTANHNGYFIHNVYIDNVPWSDTFDTVVKHIMPIMKEDGFKCLLRIRFVMYLKTETMIEHDKHFDFEWDHKGFLLYLNDCDGFTRLNDGTKVESVKNRMLMHNPGEEHNSSTTTNAPRRVVLTVNYM